MRLLPFDDSGYVDTFIMEDSLYATDTDPYDGKEELEDAKFRIRHDHLHSINPDLYIGIDTDTVDADLYDVGLFKESALVDVTDDLIQDDWTLHFRDDNPIYSLDEEFVEGVYLTPHAISFVAPNDGINVWQSTTVTRSAPVHTTCSIGAAETAAGTQATGATSTTSGSIVPKDEQELPIGCFVSGVACAFTQEQAGINSGPLQEISSALLGNLNTPSSGFIGALFQMLEPLPISTDTQTIKQPPKCVPSASTQTDRSWIGVQVPHLDVFAAHSDIECASRCDADPRCITMKMFTATSAQLALGYNHLCKLYSSAVLVQSQVPTTQTKSYLVGRPKTTLTSITDPLVPPFNHAIRRKDWPGLPNSVLNVRFHTTGYLNTYVLANLDIPGTTGNLESTDYGLLALDHVSKCQLSDGRTCTSLDRARFPPNDFKKAIESASSTNGEGKDGPYTANTVSIEPYWTVVHRGSNSSQFVVFQSDLSVLIAATIKAKGDDPDVTYGGQDLNDLLTNSVASSFVAQDTRYQAAHDPMVLEVFKTTESLFLESGAPIDLSADDASLDFSHQPNPWRGNFLAYDEKFDAWMIVPSFDPELCWLSIDDK